MTEITSSSFVKREEAVRLLDLNVNPVIFWDTCALLDIMRLPISERKNPVDRLKRVLEIKQAIVSGKILSIASELTIKEFNDNIYVVENDLLKSAKGVSNKYNDFIEFVNLLLPSASFSSVRFDTLKIEEVLMDIIQTIVSHTSFVYKHDDFMIAATKRTMDKVAPAHIKGEFKDCYIWETCLTVRKESVIRTNVYGFLSSNKTDYADATNSVQFADGILSEANASNIAYFSDFSVAYGLLKSSGKVF